MLSWGLKTKSIFSKVETLHAALSTKWKFRLRDFSEAPSATATSVGPNELSPIATGGEGIGNRTPAVMIITTMSNGYRVPGDAVGVFSERRQDKVVCIVLDIVETLSDQVCAEPTEAGKMLPLAPSGFETLSNATSQL